MLLGDTEHLSLKCFGSDMAVSSSNTTSNAPIVCSPLDYSPQHTVELLQGRNWGTRCDIQCIYDLLTNYPDVWWEWEWIAVYFGNKRSRVQSIVMDTAC